MPRAIRPERWLVLLFCLASKVHAESVDEEAGKAAQWNEQENEGETTLQCGMEVPGYQFDLTALRRSGEEDVYESTDKHGNRYYLNVCGDVAKVPSECNVLANAVRSPAYMVTDDQRCLYLGERGSADSTFWQLIDSEDPELGVELYYRDGAECSPNVYRQIRYQFFCDPDIDQALSKFDVIEFKGSCRYSVIWPTKYACPTKPVAVVSGSSSWATTFLSCFVIIGLVYVLGGIAYNMTQRGMQFGLEAMPHIELWRQLPGLVNDGFRWSRHKVNECLGSKSSTPYEKVDGVEYSWS